MIREKSPILVRPLSLVLVLLALAATPDRSLAQVTVGPTSAPKPSTDPQTDPSQRPVPAKGDPGAVFSATSGPIKVKEKVTDDDIRATLGELLGQYPGVRTVDFQVREGAVKLDGHAADEDTVDNVTAFAQKVEGVRLVLNRMKTDAEVLTGREIAAKVLGEYRSIIAKNWLLGLLAVAFVLGFCALARAFSRYSETLLSPFLSNSLVRSVAGSVVSTAIVLSGILLALSILNLTHAVLSVLGLAGVAGLALGFAFRDIAENFIASMLLGVRRPFGIGDFITVAGKSGSVLSLNTRATILITPEGNHVQIPNAVIYKETLVNASTSPSTLGSIEVVIPYHSSTAEALESITDALRSADGLLKEPPPRSLVQGLEPGGVRIRASYWMPSKGIDSEKLQSDLRLKIKVAVGQAGGAPVPTETAPIPARSANGTAASHPASPTPPHQAAEANLRKDAEAADAAGPSEHQATPIDHAIKQAEAEAIHEGGNMLVNGKA